MKEKNILRFKDLNSDTLQLLWQIFKKFDNLELFTHISKLYLIDLKYLRFEEI